MDLLLSVVSVCGGIVLFLLGKLFERKKNNMDIKRMSVETDGGMIESAVKAAGLWKGIAEQMQQTGAEMTNEVFKLRAEIHELRKENMALKEQIEMFTELVKNQKHPIEVEELAMENGKLKIQILQQQEIIDHYKNSTS